MEDNKELGHSPFRDIPDEWKLVPVKYIAPLRTEKSPITGTSISLEQIQSGTGRLLNTSETVAGDGVLFQNGDILFGKLRPYLAKVYKAESVGHAFGDIIVFAPSAVVSEFLFFVLISHEFIKEVDHSTYGTKMPRANPEFICSIRVPIPSLDEQKSISAFLHYELAKIDALINEQKRLIELLKEKRQAVISHGVTKGLNPDAPMKDSGVEWLGEVPEHWELRKVKRLFRLKAEPAPPDNDHELLSVYTDIGVKPRKELEQKGNKASTTDGYWMVKKGDLIVNKLLAWMGAVGMSDYDGVTSPAYDVLEQIETLEPYFYHLLFRNKQTQNEFKRWSRGIMEMRLRLYFDQLGQIYVPFPPLKEQREIVQRIQMIESTYSALTIEAEKQVKLLTERHSALISAAVTGKIDVSDWQPPAGSDKVDSNASVQTERHYG
ncbi:restriction endonuclease subunit S [Pseudidiomarina aestuarii]|uniref:Restriction endonuclease subunit S n=1 Tax=Pseudidiomarina aestuarii TaxID=624146 RepID=A0A2T4D3N8_9GAMM|nr:restriction endonuclease subunit S [Pseudidiomarina aestuarii]PTB89851.1 restriction endonuclease subunit S [Pseudidiomarina aestuarii]